MPYPGESMENRSFFTVMESNFTHGVHWHYFVWKLSICQCHTGAIFANKHRKRNTSGSKSHLMTARDIKNGSFLEGFAATG